MKRTLITIALVAITTLAFSQNKTKKITYYWVLLNFNESDSTTTYQEITTNMHPFTLGDSVKVWFNVEKAVIFNWKEITEKEYKLFGKFELEK